MKWAWHAALVGMFVSLGTVSAQAPPALAVATVDELLPLEASKPPVPPPPPPLPTGPNVPKLWCGSAEFGLNGSAGNSEVLKFRLGTDLKRETLTDLWKFNLLYSYATAMGVENENRAIANSRYERKIIDTPWSLFTSQQAEYDKFRAFDFRLAVHGGAAYLLWKNEVSFLKIRAGAGTSREFGGPNNQFVPELVFGSDFEYRISPRQKLTSTVDVFPQVDNFNDYRAQIQAAYELLVDPTYNLTLKIGVFDRYDSTPEGRRPNDVDYFATLMWKF
jgi:hypothetical protein